MHEESWQGLADTLGFDSERTMLQHFYLEQGFSIRQMADKLGYSTFAVRRRLLSFGIELRRRGGPNGLGITSLGHLTDEELFKTSPAELAKAYEVHISTVFTEKRRRTKRREENAAVLRNQSVETRSSNREDETLEPEDPHGSGPVSE